MGLICNSPAILQSDQLINQIEYHHEEKKPYVYEGTFTLCQKIWRSGRKEVCVCVWNNIFSQYSPAVNCGASYILAWGVW